MKLKRKLTSPKGIRIIYWYSPSYALYKVTIGERFFFAEANRSI